MMPQWFVTFWTSDGHRGWSIVVEAITEKRALVAAREAFGHTFERPGKGSML